MTANLLLSLEIVQQYRSLLRLLSPVLDNDTAAVDDFAGIAFAVDLAYPYQLAHAPINRSGIIMQKVKSGECTTYTNQPTRPIASHPAP